MDVLHLVVHILFTLEDIVTQCAIENLFALISDITLGEVSGGPSLWISCHSIDSAMGFHFGLDASAF